VTHRITDIDRVFRSNAAQRLFFRRSRRSPSAIGIRAEHIDGTTPKPERDAALARLESGEIDVLTNCMVLTEGWDMPPVACCILARHAPSHVSFGIRV
jgi:superfamily II DNA or RNA helicase